MNPKGIIIHHSLTKDNETVSWNAIRDYHINVQKWSNIGYHYGIELLGNCYNILKGRMDNEVGAHCLSFNNYIGICLVGNFDKVPPNMEQLKLLRDLCRSLMEIYGFKVSDVLGHYETYELRHTAIEKSCPGNLFSMNEFRKSL